MSDEIVRKFAALHQLANLGIASPRSLIITSRTCNDVITSLDEKSEFGYWVVRAELDHKRLVTQPAYAFADLSTIFASVFSAEPNCTLLMTRLIPAIRAGVFFKGREFVYCEYVRGALQSLVRDGVTPNRLLCSLDGSIRFLESNRSDFYYSWVGANLERRTSLEIERDPQIASLIEKMMVLVHCSPDLSIIEWVQAADEQILAIDYKSSKDDFLGDYQDIHRGLTTRCLTSIPKLWADQRRGVEASGEGSILFLERPLYSYVLDKTGLSASKLVIRAGGLLAHLVVECSRRRIPVAISQTFFDARAIPPTKLQVG